MTEPNLKCLVFPVTGGWCPIARTERGIARSFLAMSSEHEAWATIGSPRSTHCPDDALLRRARALLERFFAGKPVSFDLPLDLSERTDFQRRVLLACHAIPYGETRTYGELAATAGRPRAARAVGQVMATNVLAPIVPCHRVVGAGGALTGFGGGLELKRSLLQMEGTL